MRRESRIAVVAGSSGLIGRATCDVLRTGGWQVVGIDIASPGNSGIEEMFCDIRDPASISATLGRIQGLHAPLAALANCAGVNDAVEQWDSPTRRDFDDEVLRVNVAGANNLIRGFGDAFIRSERGGAIVTIASLYAVVGSDWRLYAEAPEPRRDKAPLYEASKAAVLALTRYYATRFAQHNVRVNAISPGGVANEQPEWFVGAYASRAPLGRLATAQDVANAVAFLVSDESAYVNGHNLVVDGGYSAW